MQWKVTFVSLLWGLCGNSIAQFKTQDPSWEYRGYPSELTHRNVIIHPAPEQLPERFSDFSVGIRGGTDYGEKQHGFGVDAKTRIPHFAITQGAQSVIIRPRSKGIGIYFRSSF